MSASPTPEAAAASEAHLLGEWARLVLASLRHAGVQDLWLSPGSRSTPFAWAASQTQGLQLHAVIDERSAAFMALGHARVSGRPSALLCTSGTAAASYWPAVVEASLAHLPLLVLTADRPLDVQHAGAAQTIDQIKLYGSQVRAFFDLGLPDAAASALQGARRALTQAVALARGPLPGPVHVNLRARKPLEPAPATNAAERALGARVDALLAAPMAHHAAEPSVSTAAIHALTTALSQASSGAIVVGPLTASNPSLVEPLAELSSRLGFPLLVEAASQARFALANHALSAPLFEWLLGAAPSDARLRPELLLSIGHTPVSSAVEHWAAQIPRRFILAEHGLPDPLGNAELVASGNLQRALRALLSELGPRRAPAPRSDFCERFLAAHAKSERCVEDALVSAASGAALSEPAVVQALLQSLPDGTTLALGNSLPIRHVDAYVPRAARLRVVVQRGANGIDGLVSGAIGSAVATTGPTVLLLGDVSLVHDVGALAAARLVTTPLVVAVIDNAGGRIFDQLPVRELYAESPKQAELWLTPPNVDFAHAAQAFGVAYAAPRSLDDVRRALTQALTSPGVTLLHLQVAPDSAAEQRRAILKQLKSELAPSDSAPHSRV